MPSYKPRKRAKPAEPGQSSMFGHADQVQPGPLQSKAPNLNPDPTKEQVMLIGEAQEALGLASPIPIVLWSMRDHSVRLMVRIYQGHRVMVIPISEVARLRISRRLRDALEQTRQARQEVLA